MKLFKKTKDSKNSIKLDDYVNCKVSELKKIVIQNKTIVAASFFISSFYLIKNFIIV